MNKSEAGKLGQLAALKTLEEARKTRLDAYNKSPKQCRQCSTLIVYEKRENNFCGSSCAATLLRKWDISHSCQKPKPSVYWNRKRKRILRYLFGKIEMILRAFKVQLNVNNKQHTLLLQKYQNNFQLFTFYV